MCAATALAGTAAGMAVPAGAAAAERAAVADAGQLAAELIVQKCVCRSSTLAALARGGMKAEHDDLAEALDPSYVGVSLEKGT